MIIVGKEFNPYLKIEFIIAKPELEDQPFYAWEDTTLILSTGEVYIVDIVSSMGLPKDNTNWKFILSDMSYNKPNFFVGEKISYKIATHSPQCCALGKYLQWKWPGLAQSRIAWPEKGGWCNYAGTTGYSFYWNVDACPGCGASLPEPGPKVLREGRARILSLLSYQVQK